MVYQAENTALLTIEELEKRSGESTRTIRYYMLNGLLSGPVGQGSAARYPAGHVARLQQIRQLQDEGRQLAAIRNLLQTVSDDELTAGQWQPPPRAQLTPMTGPLRQAGLFESDRRLTSAEVAVNRSQWERFELEPGVELHVRRPLSTAANRRVQRLLKVAQAPKDYPLGSEEV